MANTMFNSAQTDDLLDQDWCGFSSCTSRGQCRKVWRYGKVLSKGWFRSSECAWLSQVHAIAPGFQRIRTNFSGSGGHLVQELQGSVIC